jgi:membrane associated rhomboid family serine protease
LLAPFLHGSLGHLAANTIPFVILGWLVMLPETNDFFIVTAVALLASGFGVWLFGGSNTMHVGASGLIFGYFGFLLLRGYFERGVGSVAISFVVGSLYGGLIWGVLPIRRGLSWQGHLFGFIGGVLAARFLPQLQQWFQLIKHSFT